MRDFLDILKIHNCYFEANHNKSNHEYKINGNLVEFISLDQPQKKLEVEKETYYL